MGKQGGTREKKTHQTFISTQLVIVSALSRCRSITGVGLYPMLDVAGFPVTEVKLTDIFACVKVVATGLEQVAVSLPVWSYADVIFVLVFIVTVVIVGCHRGWQAVAIVTEHVESNTSRWEGWIGGERRASHGHSCSQEQRDGRSRVKTCFGDRLAYKKYFSNGKPKNCSGKCVDK